MYDRASPTGAFAGRDRFGPGALGSDQPAPVFGALGCQIFRMERTQTLSRRVMMITLSLNLHYLALPRSQ